MIALFDGNDRYTEEAFILDRELLGVLNPIFEKWIKEGYSIRDLQYVAQHTCLDLSLEALLQLPDKKRETK